MMPNADAAHRQAGKLAGLLSEVIIKSAPWSAKLGEQAKRQVTDDWLENLEKHSTHIIGPIIDEIMAATDAPEPIQRLLTHAKEPHAQFGSILQQLFVYGIMFQLAGTALQPFVQAMSNDIWAKNPDRPLSPADIATALTQAVDYGDSQGVEVPQWALDEAARSGICPDRFKTMVGIDGVAPAPTDLFTMFRRGIIDEDMFRKGLLEGPTKNLWIPALEKMQYYTPSPTDMVRAAVQGQLPYDVAEKLAHSLGLEPAGWVNGNPDWFRVMYNIGGRPPGPVETGKAALRGIIPWEGIGPDETSFAQAIHEGDIKDKWEPVLRQLAQYYPPPGIVRTMLMHGGITQDQAMAYWQADGVPTELAKAYAHISEIEQVTEDKALAKSDIMTMVQEQILTDDEAKQALAQIGYTDGNADLLVKLAHWRYNYEALRSAVRTVGRYYATWKIDATGAKQALIALGLTTDQATELVNQLAVQRKTTSPLPSAASIASAFNYGVIDQVTAQGMLQDLGYSPWHAWLELSTRKHGPLPGEPTEGKPATQPGPEQIATSQYNGAVAAAQSAYDLAVQLARQSYLSQAPPDTAGYDQAVSQAKAQLASQLAAAATEYPAAER